MRQLALLAPSLLVFSAIAGAGAPARADRVDSVRSYYGADQETIYSDVVLTHDDGTQESRQIMGGTVDGIGMLKIPTYGRLPLDYVPTVGTSNVKLHWAGSCVFLTPSSKGTHALSQDDVVAAFTAAANAWNQQAASCSYLRYMLQPGANLDVGADGKNVLVFREDLWAPGGKSTEMPYSSAATAITTVRYVNDASRADNGTILDTDIEVNAINFRMAICDGGTCRTNATNAGDVEDLQNTLTHELGHVLGLAHTCWQPSVQTTAPLDNTGHPAPNCDLGALLPASVRNATMYPFEGPMEVSKRVLTQDDVNGDCDTYPTGSDPKVCAAVDLASGGGCAVAPMPPTSDPDGGVFLAGGLLALLGIVRLRRKAQIQGTSL